MHPNQSRILRLPAVIDMTGLKRDTIYRLGREGKFPPHFKITERATGWLESDVLEYIASRARASKAAGTQTPTVTHEAAADQTRATPCSRSRKAVGGAK